MTRVLVLLGVIQIGLPLLLALARNRVMFLPSARPLPQERLDELRGLSARVVQIPRGDGRTLAAYDAEPGGVPDPSRPVVLFLHGNAGNIGYRAGLLGWMVDETDARIVMPDYSGYGGNEGSPSEDAVNEDALAAYQWIRDQGVPPSRIVVYGESIGGGPAVHLAREREVAGLVVQSGFSSLSSIAFEVYPWLPLCSVLVAGDFPNAERIAGVACPVLVVHGTDDRIVPFSEGEKLHAAAPAGAELLPVEDAGHNDLFDTGGTRYLRKLRDRFVLWTR